MKLLQYNQCFPHLGFFIMSGYNFLTFYCL